MEVIGRIGVNRNSPILHGYLSAKDSVLTIVVESDTGAPLL